MRESRWQRHREGPVSGGGSNQPAQDHGRAVGRPLPPVSLALLTVLLGLLTLDRPAGSLDEMILVVYPERMMAGDLPYRDFFTAYGPAHWWLLQGAYEVLGADVTSARMVGLLVHAALVLATYWLILPYGRALATAGGVISALLLLNLGAAPFAWLLTTALCLANVAALRDGTRAKVLLAGILAGLAISVRPDVGVLAVLPAVPLLWGRLAEARRWATGLVVGLAPFWLGLVLTGQALLSNVLGARAGKGAGQSRLPFWPNGNAARQLLLLLVVAVLLCCLLALRERSRILIALACLSVAALPQAFQRADGVHFVYAGLFSMPLLPLVAHELLRSRFDRRAGRHGALAAGLLFIIVTPGWVLVPLLDEIRDAGPASVVVEHHGRRLPSDPDSARTLRQLLRTLDRETTPGQTVFVYDNNLVRPAVNDVGLYHLLPSLRQDAYNMEITPGVTAFPGGRLLEDLQEADVAVLIDIPEEFRTRLFPFSRNGSDEAQRELARSFCRLATVDYYAVYRRCVPRP